MSENAFPRAVADYLKKHTTTLADGRIVATTETGSIRYHSDRDGCPEWSAKDLAEHLKLTKPSLWTETAAKADPAPAASKVSGPDPWRHASKTLTAAPGSVSDLMAKAKAGDAAALAAIKSELGIA